MPNIKMALTIAEEVGLKLQVEVENDVVEAMDVDEIANEKNEHPNSGGDESELEEGEISDSKDDEPPIRSEDFRNSMKDKQSTLSEFERRYENKSGAFVTGIDIFSKDGQEKLDVRAKRFGLDPSQVKPLTEVQLRLLYESLGIADLEEGTLEKQGFRLDALHIRGTEDMSTQDVFDYFKDFGPASIEWINDICCNVVWLDKASPARALLGLSRPITGLTAAGRRDFEEIELVDEEEGEVEEEVDGAGATKGGDIKQQDEPTQVEVEDGGDKVQVAGEAVPASQIQVPVPPGLWRLGAESPKSKCILLRYCTRSDRKPKQAEKMSEYYKKYGNPNYGGIRGIISTSRKRRFHDIRHEPEAEECEGKNPWGSLAQNWGTMDHSHTKPGFFDPDDPLLLERPGELRDVLNRVARDKAKCASPSRRSSESGSELDSEEEDIQWRKRLKVPQRRMHADIEEKKILKRRKMKARLGAAASTSPPSSLADDLRLRLPALPPCDDEEDDLRVKLDSRPILKRGSVWKRLEVASLARDIEVTVPLTPEQEEEDDEDEVVVSTVRSQVNDLRQTIASKKSSDLRSRLGNKKDKRSRSTTPPYKKSPLRIEINNDEYCGSSSGSGSSSSSDTNSGSSSESEEESS